MILRHLLLAFSLAVASSVTAGSFPVHADSRAMVLPTHSQSLIAETSSGARRFTIEIADEQSEQARGLMFRQDMADDHGMLFDLGSTRQAGFWMENTPMPLDLVFIGDDGRVRAVLEGVPFSRAEISPGVPVRFVLELKKGTAERNGIKAGDRLRHPAIDAVAGSN